MSAYQIITLDGQLWLTDGEQLLASVEGLGDLFYACDLLLDLACDDRKAGYSVPVAAIRYANAALRRVREGAL